MPELQHTYGSDLTLGPTGDLALSSDSQEGQERVLRRLLTNQGDYIWNLVYGAGLPQFVGQPARAQRIRAVIRSQMQKERAVARVPEPTVSVTSSPAGTVFAQVNYTDATTGQTVVLNVPIGQ